MCGRITLTYDISAVNRYLNGLFDISLDSSYQLPRYNIAPSQDVIAVIRDVNSYRAGAIKWGLIPPDAPAKYQGFKSINLRQETLMKAKKYHDSLQIRRCLIIADGFYEWQKGASSSQPYWITHRDHSMMMLAGIWGKHMNEEGIKTYTAAILTTEADASMQTIHPRMPVIISPETARRWLDSSIDGQSILKAITMPDIMHQLTLTPISTRVNHAGRDDPSLIEPITLV